MSGEKRIRWGPTTLLVSLGLALGAASGCGNLTSGGFGEVEVVVAADEVASTALRGLDVGPDAETLARLLGPNLEGTGTSAELQGHLQLRLRAYLAAEEGDWIEITEGAQELQLDLQQPEAQVAARRELEEGSYARARIVFSHVQAVITEGLVVEGDTITGPVRVDLGAEGRVEIQTPVALEVRAGRTSALLLDMKTEGWLRRLDIVACRALDCRVRDQEFQEEVRLRAQDR